MATVALGSQLDISPIASGWRFFSAGMEPRSEPSAA
jgi:hypothetical protein